MKRTLAIACWLSTVGIGASAQITKSDTLREVTVTETRHNHALRSTTPTHIINHGDLSTMGITDMADALHRIPGITLRDYGGAGGMKTVSVRGFGTKHTGVSYDGVMLSECQSGEIDLSRYSLDNVAYLSLTVGDNEDIFVPARQASTPATLTIQTTSPMLDGSPSGSHLTAQLKAGSFGYVSPFLRYDQRLSSNFSLSAVGEYVYAENDYPYTVKNGVETIHDHRRNSCMNQGHGELNAFWLTGRTSQLSAKLYYYDNDRQLPGQVRYYTNVSRETLHDRNAFGQFRFQTHWHDRLSLKWLGKYNWAASSYRDPLYTGGVMDADYWQREAYTAAALLYTPTPRLSIDYSADYAMNNLNSSLSTDTRPYRHTILQSATARLTGQRLTVMARLLYSLYLNGARQGIASDDMRRLSPSLSLSYRMLADHSLYVRASYKNIFRAPTFNENYYFHYGSPDLLPETTDQLNLGVTYATAPSYHTELSVTADGYYNEVKDKIIAIPYNMFVWRCINVGKVKTLGADISLRLSSRLTPHASRLTLYGTYSYQRSENRSLPGSPTYGRQLAYTPEHTGSIAVAYENPWVNVSLHGQGVSKRWANNEHYASTDIQGYWETGLTIWRSFTLRHCRIEGRLDLKNLTNQQYEIVRFYPMPGRCYLITLNIKL